MAKRQPRLLLIDGNNYTARAYHATGRMTDSEGNPTNAIKGFLSIFLADLYKLRPTHVGITFDKKGKQNWRCDIHPEYKANRAEVFKKKDKKSLEAVKKIRECRAQIEPIKELLRAMGFRVINKAGVEADDLMGTLAVQYAAKGFEVIVSSSDKDLCQLVGGDIRIMKPSRELFGQREVFDTYGVLPNQIVEYLAMLGDSVDNVPGLRGVGPATARQLLGDYGTIKKILKNRKNLKPAQQKIFATASDQLKLNVKLITLKLDEKHKVRTDQLAYPPIENHDAARVKKLCRKHGLKATHTQIEGIVRTWNSTPTKKAPTKGLW